MDAISRGFAMRRVHVLLLYLLAALAICASGTVRAQTSQAHAKPAETQVFNLEPVRQLRKGVDAWPLILYANDAASKRVNAILQEMNQRLTGALKECDTNYAAPAKEGGDASTGEGGTAGDWERKVEVTMADPRFLSIVATDDFIFCGAAYPDSDRIAMVFDMSTGDPVAWTAMIAKSAGASSVTDTGYDGTEVGALILPALEKINLAAASPECKDAFTDQQPFLLWPDAQKQQLVAIASGLPHVVAACEQEIHLTMEQVHALGFDETMIDSIELAHRRSMATPKP